MEQKLMICSPAELFDRVRSTSLNFIISFSENGNRYQLNFITAGIKDPLFRIFKGSLVCVNEKKLVVNPDNWEAPKEITVDHYFFKFNSARIFIWERFRTDVKGFSKSKVSKMVRSCRTLND